MARIAQAYISKSVADFPFLEIYNLDDYNDQNAPCVFFGMYRNEDRAMLMQHNGPAIVFWTGQDVLQEKWKWDRTIFNGPNTTAHPKVQKALIKKGNQCSLVQPSSFLNTIAPQKLGDKIYAYCPLKSANYHGLRALSELEQLGIKDIVIGTGEYSQEEWRETQADLHYKDVGVGLCLSEFAGGGTSIIEMGLRGIPVITNVFDLPNCYSWETAEDVVQRIDQCKRAHQGVNKVLARSVWRALDHEYKWLEMKTAVYDSTIYLSDRDKETLKALLFEINLGYSSWGDDFGVEFWITPRQIGFVRKLIKELNDEHPSII